jgi:hypothetical protein
LKKVKADPSLPGSIWALGFVSMFMDISSEFVAQDAEHQFMKYLESVRIG